MFDKSLSPQGHITAQGTYRDFQCSGLDVASLMRSDEEQDKYSRIAEVEELEKQSLHSQTNCSFSSLLPPDCSVTEEPPVCAVAVSYISPVLLWSTVVKNTSLQPLMSFCFFQRQKQFLPFQRRPELRETLVGTFTTSTSLQTVTSWF